MTTEQAFKNSKNNTPCTCFYLRRASRAVTRMYDSFLHTAGINSAQFGMLKNISALHKVSITALGVFLSMDQTTATRNVEVLQKQGYLVLNPDPSDGRKKIISLSQSGKKKLIEANPLWEQAQVKIENILGNKEMEQLVTTLETLTIGVE